jgi:hypothetical protein
MIRIDHLTAFIDPNLVLDTARLPRSATKAVAGDHPSEPRRTDTPLVARAPKRLIITISEKNPFSIDRSMPWSIG